MLPDLPLGCLWESPGSKRVPGGGRGWDYKSQAALRARKPCGAAGSGEGGSGGGGGAEALGPGRRRLARWLARRGLRPAGRRAAVARARPRGRGGAWGPGRGGSRRGCAATCRSCPVRAAARLPQPLFRFDAAATSTTSRARRTRCPRPPGHRRRLLQLPGPDEAAEPGAEPPAHFQVHSAREPSRCSRWDRAPAAQHLPPGGARTRPSSVPPA